LGFWRPHVEAVEDAGNDFDVARHPGLPQALGAGEILVVEQVVGANADPCWRQPAEIIVPPWDGDVRVSFAEICRPAEMITAGVPQPVFRVVVGGRTAVIEHGIRPQLECGGYFAAVAGQQGQGRGEPAAGTGAADRHRPRVSGDAFDEVFDEAVTQMCTGPTIELGCGPGRLVARLMQRGIPALGIDRSTTAIRLAGCGGAPALLGDVFEPLPGTGRWQTVCWSTATLASAETRYGCWGAPSSC